MLSRRRGHTPTYGHVFAQLLGRPIGRFSVYVADRPLGLPMSKDAIWVTDAGWGPVVQPDGMFTLEPHSGPRVSPFRIWFAPARVGGDASSNHTHRMAGSMNRQDDFHRMIVSIREAAFNDAIWPEAVEWRLKPCVDTCPKYPARKAVGGVPAVPNTPSQDIIEQFGT